MRKYKKGCQKTWAAVNIKISMFNLQYLSYLYKDFYATDMGKSTVKLEIASRRSVSPDGT